jgi:hypothetical protein
MTICLVLDLGVFRLMVSLFSWTEESSNEDLDYFAALDVAAAESSPRVEVGEVADPPSARTKCRR